MYSRLRGNARYQRVLSAHFSASKLVSSTYMLSVLDGYLLSHIQGIGLILLQSASLYNFRGQNSSRLPAIAG